MRFSVLGPLTVTASTGAPVVVPEAKVRALLSALLLDAGRVVPADRLVEALWGDRLPLQPGRGAPDEGVPAAQGAGRSGTGRR